MPGESKLIGFDDEWSFRVATLSAWRWGLRTLMICPVCNHRMDEPLPLGRWLGDETNPKQAKQLHVLGAENPGLNGFYYDQNKEFWVHDCMVRDGAAVGAAMVYDFDPYLLQNDKHKWIWKTKEGTYAENKR